MRRRDVIAGVATAALVWPRSARAQAATPVIGFLGSASPDAWGERLRAFREGLAAAGFAEGKNVAVEARWAEGNNERLPALAADLVRRQVSVIVVLGNTRSTLAAKAATRTIPIVFRVAADPVGLGLVASLNRPGGNLTGITTRGVEVGPKQLELLHDLVPSATIIGLLVNPSNPILADIQARDVSAAARSLGVRLEVVEAQSDQDFDTVFAALNERRASGLVIGADTFFNSRNERLAGLALRNRVPTISPYSEFARAGGLMSYGGSIAEASRQAGVYTGRILKGEKPHELPVQQVAKVELVINLKTAKALGLHVPAILRDRADEVIE